MSEAEALKDLGAYLTATEARQIANRLEDEEPLSSAIAAVDPARRGEAVRLITQSGVSDADLVAVLRTIQGAKSVVTSVQPVWTMPGHLVSASPLTTSTTELVRSARSSVVCSTFNFQKTSGLWEVLREVARRPGVQVRLYLDAEAAAAPTGPSAAEIAAWIAPGLTFATVALDGKPVRNHAKFVVVDHRFLLVTSANYSWSAENRNVELGLRIDDIPLATGIEAQMRAVEGTIYKRVEPDASEPGRVAGV